MLKRKTGLIYIRKRPIQEVFTGIIFIFPFIMAFLFEGLKLPLFIKYFIDILYIGALIMKLAGRSTYIQKKHAPFVIFMVVFLMYTFFTYLFNYQSPFYYLWGVRNNFRFYIAFLLFMFFFDEEDAFGCLKIMDVLFWINAIISFFQFFVLGYRQDNLGGLFGVETGCNAFTIFFFSIIIGKSLLLFMNKQQKAWICFTKCGISLVLAAMAELKFYFVLFAAILLLSTVLTRFSFRKVILILGAASILMFTSLLLPAIFGESRTLNLENLIETITAKNYATSKDLGRFTAIPTISRNILTDWAGRLFGMGLGNCDTSSFAVCNSEFYQTHSYLNYNWFSSAFLFLETGYIGLIIYLSFFVLCFILARKQLKSKEANNLLCCLGMIMCAVCFVMVFYNSALRTEIGYMAFFSLSLPFMRKNSADFNSENYSGYMGGLNYVQENR